MKEVIIDRAHVVTTRRTRRSARRVDSQSAEDDEDSEDSDNYDNESKEDSDSQSTEEEFKSLIAIARMMFAGASMWVRLCSVGYLEPQIWQLAGKE